MFGLVGSRIIGVHLRIPWRDSISSFRSPCDVGYATSNDTIWTRCNCMCTYWRCHWQTECRWGKALLQNDFRFHLDLLFRHVVHLDYIQKRDCWTIFRRFRGESSGERLYASRCIKIHCRWMLRGPRLWSTTFIGLAINNLQNHADGGILGHSAVSLPFCLHSWLQCEGFGVWCCYRSCFAGYIVLCMPSHAGLGENNWRGCSKNQSGQCQTAGIGLAEEWLTMTMSPRRYNHHTFTYELT